MSSTVTITEGIEYGFALLLYVLGVGLAGGIVVLVGFFIGQGGGMVATFIGGLIALVGMLVIYAGLFGIGYKVIADGVSVGVESANT